MPRVKTFYCHGIAWFCLLRGSFCHRLLSGSADGTAKVWLIPPRRSGSGEVQSDSDWIPSTCQPSLFTTLHHGSRNYVYDAKWHPQSPTCIVTAAYDGDIRLWGVRCHPQRVQFRRRFGSDGGGLRDSQGGEAPGEEGKGPHGSEQLVRRSGGAQDTAGGSGLMEVTPDEPIFAGSLTAAGSGLDAGAAADLHGADTTHGTLVNCIAFTRGGFFMYTGDAEGRIFVWEVTGSATQSFRLQGE